MNNISQCRDRKKIITPCYKHDNKINISQKILLMLIETAF